MTLFTISLRSLLTILLLYVSFTAFATITIGEVTPATSAGSCNGSIQVIATGDAGPFDLIIEGTNGYLNFKDEVNGSLTFTGLCGGAYTIRVINAYMCETVLDTTVACPLTFQQSVTESSCTTGGSSITVTPQDGTAPYTYTWKNEAGATAGGNTATINNLPPDRYFVTITDANGCKATGDFSTEPTGDDAIYPYIKEVKVYALVGGTETLIYQAAWTLTAAGCIKYIGGSLPISLDIFDAYRVGTAGMRVEATVSKELLDLDVFVGSNTPIQKVSVDNVNWAFTFDAGIQLEGIQDGKINQLLLFLGGDNNGNSILLLAPNSGCVTLPTLDENCEWTPTPSTGRDISHIIKRDCDINPPSLSVDQTNAVCPGATTGNICLKVEGDGSITSYSFLWEDGSTGPCISNVLTGRCYSVTVTDACGTSTQGCFEVPVGAAPNITPVTIKPSCSQPNNGEIEISVVGGTAPYNISWSNGATSLINQNLASGNYCVTVTDSKNCQSSDCFQVSEYPSINIVELDITSACNGGSNGQIEINILQGTSPYLINWSNGQTSTVNANIQSGNYCVTVTDANSCEVEECFEVPATNLNYEVVKIKHTTTMNTNDGEIEVNATSSTGSQVSYSWSGPSGFSSTNNHITNLEAGDYALTITNQEGCRLVLYFTIEPCFRGFNEENPTEILIVNGSRTQIQQPDIPKGAIALTVSGGIPASYQFKWAGPNGFTSTQQNIGNLDAGNYCVTLTDGCQTVSECFEIIDCSTISLGVFANNITNTCYGTSYGEISVSVFALPATYSGSPYSYVWSNGKSDANIRNLSSGEYTVTVTDRNGCKTSGVFSVNDSSPIRTTKTQSSDECKFFDYCNDPQNRVGIFKEGNRSYINPPTIGGVALWCGVTEICSYPGVEPSTIPIPGSKTGITYTHDGYNCYAIDQCYIPQTMQTFLSNKTVVPPAYYIDYNKASYPYVNCASYYQKVRVYYCADGYPIKTECIDPVTPVQPDDSTETSELRISEDIEAVMPDIEFSSLNYTDENTNIEELLITNVYPNPSENSVEVVIQTSFPGNIELLLFDMVGNKMMQNEVYVDSFSAGLKLQFNERFPSGVYQIVVKDEKGNTATHKIVRITK